jgi:hypothetical protein
MNRHARRVSTDLHDRRRAVGERGVGRAGRRPRRLHAHREWDWGGGCGVAVDVAGLMAWSATLDGQLHATRRWADGETPLPLDCQSRARR